MLRHVHAAVAKAHTLQLEPRALFQAGKMTADQLTMLEKQHLERTLLEKAGLARLSLFYMR